MEKVCLVTGAAGGIGFGVAKAFYEAGYAVVITDVNLQQARLAEQRIAEDSERLLALALDVSQMVSVSAAFSDVLAHWGRIDVVINNAGVQHISPLEDFTLADWQKVVTINLNGSFLVSQQAIKVMKQQMFGNIIFIGSIHSVAASKNKSAYIAAKHGLLGLMRSVAQEGIAYNICSNMVSPGFVKTPLVEKQIPEQAQQLGLSEDDVVSKLMLGNTIDGEFTTIDDVAQTCLFFAQFPSAALNGQSLLLTHGWQMQ